MCTSCDCKCKTLTLEVGKTYLWRDGTHVKIIFKDGDLFVGKPITGVYGKERYYSFKVDGKTTTSTHSDLVKEHKEPEFRYFPIWKKNAGNGHANTFDTREGALKHGQFASIIVSPFIAIAKVNQDTCEITIEKV